jgi:hypothetical protein
VSEKEQAYTTLTAARTGKSKSEQKQNHITDDREYQ